MPERSRNGETEQITPLPPLKVAFFVPFLRRYRRGIERSSIQLANELATLGHLVTLIAWREDGGGLDWEIDTRVRLVEVPYFRYLRSFWAIPFYVKELYSGRHEVVVVYFAGFGEAPAIRVARWFRDFRVYFIVGYPPDLVPHRFVEFQHFGLDRALQGIIVKSDQMAPQVGKLFDCPIHVIANGVDIERFHPPSSAATAREPKRDKARVFLTVAALEERKGIQYALAAVAALIRDGHAVRYVILGEGPYRRELETLSQDLGISNRVSFEGAVDDPLPFYRDADVFLLLSRGEGFPNVLLEAWAMALPVVVSRHPPFPDVVSAEIGFIVDERNPTEVGSVLSDLLRSDDLRKDIGGRARDHAASYYSWRQIARRYEAVFRWAAVGGRGSVPEESS